MTRSAHTAADPQGYQGIELIYYGQLGLTRDADAVLDEFGFGRAHFRAMYVIARNPGITSNELLRKLMVTNQSLSRVMRQLLAGGMVTQASGVGDRRQRMHFLTERGLSLETKVLHKQCRALHRAYEAAGAGAVKGFLRVLFELIPPEHRDLLSFPLK